MDMPSLLKGVAGLGLVMLEVVGFLGLMKGLNLGIGQGVALIALAVSLNLFATALLIIGSMDARSLVTGIAGLGMVLVEIAGFLALMKGLDVGLKRTGALILLAISINIFAVALRSIGSMDTSSLVKGVAGLGLVLLEIVGFLALMKGVDVGLKQTGALLLLGMSLNLFAAAVGQLGNMNHA